MAWIFLCSEYDLQQRRPLNISSVVVSAGFLKTTLYQRSRRPALFKSIYRYDWGLLTDLWIPHYWAFDLFLMELGDHLFYTWEKRYVDDLPIYLDSFDSHPITSLYISPTMEVAFNAWRPARRIARSKGMHLAVYNMWTKKNYVQLDKEVQNIPQLFKDRLVFIAKKIK